MKISNFSKTFKNEVFKRFEISDFFATNPPLVSLLAKTRGGGGLLREMTLIALQIIISIDFFF